MLPYSLNKKIIGLLIQKIGDIDYKSFFKIYNNSGLQKIFEMHENNLYASSIKNKLNNLAWENFENFNLIPLFFIQEYQEINNKNKKETIYDLYPYKDENLINDLHINKYFEQNLNIINDFINITNSLIASIITENYNELLLEQLNDIYLDDTDSIYFHEIKKNLIDIIENNDFSNSNIEYLIFIYAILDYFKNNNPYLIYNEYVNKDLLEITKGNHNTKSLKDIKTLSFFKKNNKINDYVNQLVKNFIQELNKNTYWYNEESNYLNLNAIKNDIKNFLEKIKNFNLFFNNENLFKLIKDVEEKIDSGDINLEYFCNSINIIPHILNNNNTFLINMFQKYFDNYIFSNDIKGKTMTNEAILINGLMYFRDEIVNDKEVLKQFIEDNFKLINENNNSLLNTKNNFNYNDYEYQKNIFKELKENCLKISLQNLAEPYFLLEKLFDYKIKKETPINENEYNIARLININFTERIKDINRYISGNGDNFIGTPIIEIYKRFSDINNEDYEYIPSKLFLKTYKDNKEIINQFKYLKDKDINILIMKDSETYTEKENKHDSENELFIPDVTFIDDSDNNINNNNDDDYDNDDDYSQDININLLTEDYDFNNIDINLENNSINEEKKYINTNIEQNNNINPISNNYSFDNKDIINNIGVINYISEKQSFLISGKYYISAKEWSLFVNNTQYNIESILGYNNELEDNYRNEENDILVDSKINNHIDNLIADFEKVKLFNSVTLLIKFRFYMAFLVDNGIAYNLEIGMIIKKVIESLYNFIVLGKPEYNYEDFNHLITFIESYHYSYEQQFIKIVMKNNIDNAFSIINSNVDSKLNNIYEVLNENREIFNKFEESFSKFNIATISKLNKITSMNDNNDRIDSLDARIEKMQSTLEDSMKIINKNIKTLYDMLGHSNQKKGGILNIFQKNIDSK